MGEVYCARDTRLGRDVALKILPDTFATDPDRLMRFQREAKTLAALNHPHIAQIYGIVDSVGAAGGAAESPLALVMELVSEEDRAQRIARGPSVGEEAIAIAHQIIAALEAAHDSGIIHRDLKPANVKLRTDGTVKVLDFGLAKTDPTLSSGSRVVASVTSPAMTMQGLILGTAAYMAPEQAKGNPSTSAPTSGRSGACCSRC
jgi:eukaryotic-like serine/threonine-protein kinase